MHLPVLAKFTSVLAECICVAKDGNKPLQSLKVGQHSVLKLPFLFPFDLCVGNLILRLHTV